MLSGRKPWHEWRSAASGPTGGNSTPSSVPRAPPLYSQQRWGDSRGHSRDTSKRAHLPPLQAAASNSRWHQGCLLGMRLSPHQASGRALYHGEKTHKLGDTLNPTLCDPMDCSLPGSSIHGILQARTLKWVAISFSRGSSQPRDWTWEMPYLDLREKKIKPGPKIISEAQGPGRIHAMGSGPQGEGETDFLSPQWAKGRLEGLVLSSLLQSADGETEARLDGLWLQL